MNLTMKLSLVVCAMLATLSTCCARPPASPNKVTAAEDLRSKTVALVQIDDSEIGVRAYCTGVWVAESLILTADHCSDDGELGTEMLFVTPEDVYKGGSSEPELGIQPHRGVILTRDEDHDLVVLKVDRAPWHEVATVATYDPQQGQFAQEIGQSLGLWWSYSSGDVAATRVLETVTTGKPTLFVQTTTPTSPGNSGGGLFDGDGALIGLCHGGFTRGQNVNLFIHPRYIRGLLSTIK